MEIRMTDNEKKFLDKHFKAGEYGILTIMVPNNEMERLISVLQKENLNLVIMPSTKPMVDFVTKKDGEIN
jgi:hypothetical protein